MMADEFELYLSDVHTENEYFSVSEDSFGNEMEVNDKVKSSLKLVRTRFVFELPAQPEDSVKTNHLESTALVYDEDGDMVICKERTFKHAIIIEHYLSTPLSLVGLQVWCGSLLLADYLLHSSSILKGNYILELGAGTGICSIIASVFAHHVFCTDVGTAILSLCQRNVNNHIHSLTSNDRGFRNMLKLQNPANITVKELDWDKSHLFIKRTDSIYGWEEKEKTSAERVSVFLAADVIYDDNLTDMFFKTAKVLMEKQTSKTLYLSLEKRLNFTLDALDVASPAYDYFRLCIDDLVSETCGKYHWTVQNIPTDFPQYFKYSRSQQLELWKFQCFPQ